MSLNSRQWCLYDYLKRHSNEYKHLEEILEDEELKFLYPQSDPSIPINNRANRRILSDDLTALKKSDIIQVVIMSDPGKGIKLATEEEYYEHLNKERISILKQLAVNYRQLEKAKLNNQTRLKLAYEKEIIESLLKTDGGDLVNA